MKLAYELESINTGDTTVCAGEVRVTKTCSLAGLVSPRAGGDIMSVLSAVKTPPLHHTGLPFLKRKTVTP